MAKIQELVKNPSIIISHIISRKFFRFLPDMVFLRIKYRLLMKRKLNLRNPKAFNEKIQWLKVYDRKPEYTSLVDKYAARKFVGGLIGEEYLVPLIGVYQKFEDIDFNILPGEFVLKPNHTSGDIFLCGDKSKLNHKKLKSLTEKWIKREFFWYGREWPYKNITPLIICEKFLRDDSIGEVRDYKFLCYDGEPKCSFVCSNRGKEGDLKVDFFDVDWTRLPFERHYRRSEGDIPKPKNYETMLKFASKLSLNIPFLRVDFYECNDHLYFGELTFYPGSGFEEFSPESYDYLLGSWLQLPEKHTVEK